MSATITIKRNGSIRVEGDFVLLDAEENGADNDGVGVMLTITGYNALVMGGYKPYAYSADCYTDDAQEAAHRVQRAGHLPPLRRARSLKARHKRTSIRIVSGTGLAGGEGTRSKGGGVRCSVPSCSGTTGMGFGTFKLLAGVGAPVGGATLPSGTTTGQHSQPPGHDRQHVEW